MTTTRRAAASALCAGVATLALAGVGAAAATPAAATAATHAATVAPAAATPQDSSPAPDPTGQPTEPPVTVAPTQAPTQQPTAAPTPEPTEPTSAPTQAEPTATAAEPTQRSTATRSAIATSTAHATYVPTTRPSERVYVNPYDDTSTSNTDGGTYTGDADSDLPTGVQATGAAPVATVTLKPGQTADPVYGAAAVSTSSHRRYVDVQGVSVNEVLGYMASAGAVIGLVGGAGLWLTRGAR